VRELPLTVPGEHPLAGTLIRRPTPAWFPPDATAGWLSRWHGFGWLDDLMAVGTSARDPARVLIQSWLSEGAAWHPVTWRPDVAATRILAWIVHFEELAGRDADRALRRAMLASIAAQVRHLARVAGWELTGWRSRVVTRSRSPRAVRKPASPSCTAVAS